MTADDMTFMREWAREHGQPVRQMSVRQLSTMDKPGTLPISAYRTPLAVEPMEYLDEEEPPRQAEVEAEATEVSSSEVEDDVTDNEYDSESEESDSEEEAPEQEKVETSTVPTYSYYQHSRSGRAIRPVFRLDLSECCDPTFYEDYKQSRQSTVHSKTVARLVKCSKVQHKIEYGCICMTSR